MQEVLSLDVAFASTLEFTSARLREMTGKMMTLGFRCDLIEALCTDAAGRAKPNNDQSDRLQFRVIDITECLDRFRLLVVSKFATKPNPALLAGKARWTANLPPA